MREPAVDRRARRATTGSPGSEYFSALSSRLAIALTIWRRSQHRASPEHGVTSSACPAAAAAPATRSTAASIELDDRHLLAAGRRATRSGRGRAGRRRSRRRAVGLGGDPLGELARDLGVVDAGERLGEHGQRADRRLELVAHVGDEVAPHRLDAAGLGDVADEPDRADPAAVGDAAGGRS